MRAGLLISVLLGSAAWADEPKEDAVKTELKKLEGTWVVEGAFVRGLEIERHAGKKLVISGTTLTSYLDGKEEPGEIKIDPTKKVKEIDSAEKGKTFLGVYELDGDTLRLCFGDQKRPAKVSKDDLLFVLKRAKK
jgi:uncharacterized protein (TIGR03067 family)